jgi:hypothetical protein
VRNGVLSQSGGKAELTDKCGSVPVGFFRSKRGGSLMNELTSPTCNPVLVWSDEHPRDCIKVPSVTCVCMLDRVRNSEIISTRAGISFMS